ncbi:MAG TPA: hypothetical protein VK652_15420, partial [Steroidobacteraceae bacterium]|nr:hypothetical protein [Steroidobacteraceae bacterium]
MTEYDFLLLLATELEAFIANAEKISIALPADMVTFGEAALDLQTRLKNAAREHRLDIAQQFVAHRVAVASAMRDPVVERCV